MSTASVINSSVAIDSDIKVVEILMDQIYSDEDFNCRGYIAPSSVIELARDIATNGLQSPIIVQEFSKIAGKHYRIIAGHRRYAAFLVNKAERIPSIIRVIEDEIKALVLNLNENIQRENLNILQEAKAIERLKNKGWTQDDVAKTFQKSRAWSQIRFYVLDFPDDIQTAIGENWINQAQIHTLHQLNTIEEQYAAVRAIKDAKIASGTKRLPITIRKPAKKENLLKAKARKTDEINIMLEHMIDEGLEPCFATRCLAWAAGNITTFNLLQDVEKEMAAQGVAYTLPHEGIIGL